MRNLGSTAYVFESDALTMKAKYKVLDHPSIGKYVVATHHYSKAEIICVGKSRGNAPVRDNYSLQIHDRKHVYLDEPAQLISHSCEPNLYIADNDFGGYNFYAARKIEPGETLSFHYGMSEAKSISVSTCCCGSDTCLGKSIGFKDLMPHQQDYLYRLGVASYLREWYERRNPELSLAR